MAGTLYLQLLGGLRIAQDEHAVTGFVSNKARALFCYLVVTRRVHLRSALAAFFWGDHSQHAANANLRVVLSNLHQLLGSYLTITRDTVAFNTDSLYCADIELFQRKLNGFPDGAVWDVEGLQEAVELYTGAFLQGFYVRDATDFNEWMLAQREEQRRLVLQALHRLVINYTTKHNYINAISLLRRLLDLDPWSEEAHRELIRMLALTGQRDKALLQYQACQRILAEDLGVEPTQETMELYHAIRADEFGAVPAPVVPQHSLVLPPTPLLGRNADVARVTGLLGQPACRLLILYGPAGAGKTRLALEVAAQLQDSFGDGIFCVDLAPLTHPDQVGDAIGAVLVPLMTAGGRLRPRLEEVLRDKELLLVLDNFEHVLPAAPLLGRLLAACPRLTVLVTSRVVLSLRGARHIQVPPLSLPNLEGAADHAALLQNPAVALFVERARAVNPAFRLTDHAADAVAEICVHLDGLPLAIELAAARSHVLPPAAMLERSGSWLTLLTGGTWDQPTRHQTLRDAIAWSYRLLDEGDRRLFRWLSALPPRFTLADAERLCAAMDYPSTGVLDSITALVNNSLLMVAADHEQAQPGEPRFGMLHTTRAYGLEQLELSGEVIPTWNGPARCGEASLAVSR